MGEKNLRKSRDKKVEYQVVDLRNFISSCWCFTWEYNMLIPQGHIFKYIVRATLECSCSCKQLVIKNKEPKVRYKSKSNTGYIVLKFVD